LEEKSEQFPVVDPKNQTEKDREFAERMNKYFPNSIGTNIDKLRNFPKYVPRQNLSLFLAKNELFKKVVGIHGHVIELGVFLGSGLMTWAQLSAIYEPYNNVRRIVGFDNFTGFEKIHEKDKDKKNLDLCVEGGLKTNAYDDVKSCVELYDLNRPIGHIPRVELEVGDVLETIPIYLKENKQLVISLLYLDMDLYEPTKIALEHFLPRMPKGAILAFDELNQRTWPGETVAVFEIVGLRNLRIERFPFTPQISYAVLE